MSERQDLEFVLAAWEAGQYQQVVKRGSSLIESGADASSIIVLYADSLVELDRTSEAREAFKFALRILPMSRHRRIFDALAALELHADCYAAAEEYCQRAIALAPHHASAHIHLGIAYANTDRLADAEAQFTRGTACTDGAIDEAWYNLGQVQSTRGQTLEAATSFRRALAIDPEYELALEALATLEGGPHRAPEA